ncbi:alpha/beta hydrolase [Nucisporomicrobium flavum]|uniref:alpha/beta hydrolase n=1 Tax=Nucisporomicrobium flavum TaxID=2785915 RepID=UPI0018F4F722|nr:alpha/beta hydrolase [Nucisporomicrobium flavum]
MSLTLKVLWDTSPEAIATRAAAWTDMAKDIDDAAEEVIRGSRDVEDVWPSGAAAEAAWKRAAELRAEVSNAYNPCKRIGQALREHADTVRSLQEQLRDITTSASKAGFDVDIASGTVTAPQRMYDETTAPHTVAQQVSAYVGQLQGVLDRAAESDDRCAGVITVNLPDPRSGFGSLSLRPVSKQDLESQKGRPPKDVRAWWDSLTPEQQEQAIQDYPELVGWLDGVPASDRDVANRITLDRNLADLNSQRTSVMSREDYLKAMAEQGRLGEVYPESMNPVGSYLAEMDQLEKQREDLDNRLKGPTTIHNRLGDPNKPPALLMGFDPAGDGKAIVSIGDPDTADNVVTYVPGTTSDLPGFGTDLNRADVMRADADIYGTGGSTASIVWLGYDAPDAIPNATKAHYAEDGAPALRQFQEGLRATHDGDPSHNTVIGHSYGSTTVGYAAKDGHLAADDLIFVGSPGVGVDSATELHFDGGAQDVYASTAKNDIISGAGLDDTMVHGENPDNPGFGGRQFTSADGSFWHPIDTHSQYWDQGNPSRKNIALVVTGQGDKVS